MKDIPNQPLMLEYRFGSVILLDQIVLIATCSMFTLNLVPGSEKYPSYFVKNKKLYHLRC